MKEDNHDRMRIVMKFGGSLLNDEIKVSNVTNIIKSYFESGNEIIVIISALDGTLLRLYILAVLNLIKSRSFFVGLDSFSKR